MPYDLQISIRRRVLTPEEGQAKLKEISEATKASTIVGYARLVVPGATTQDDPFPKWLTEQIKGGIPGVLYDEINYIWFRRYETAAEAQEYRDWVLEIREWAKNVPEREEFADKIEVRLYNTDVGDIKDNDIESF